MPTAEQLRAWREAATRGANLAEEAADLFRGSRGPDAAIQDGAMVSIALSLSVIAESLVTTLESEAE